MSDFLRNLRSSHSKDRTDPKRNLDGHYYPQKDRRKLPDRRTNNVEKLESLWSCLNEVLPKILDNTTLLTKYLQKNQEKQALLIEAKVRQHNAIADFFDNMNSFFNENKSAYVSNKGPKATASYATGTHYTKDDILMIIRNMRKDGATFAVIAGYLNDKGIPTFSGRGDWHAQTIHRLCK